MLFIMLLCIVVAALNTHFSVEGISITHGSPHQHVWSLISGYSEANANANAFLALVAVDQMTVTD